MFKNKQENFKRISENKTNKIIEMISSLRDLSNVSYYEYTNEQIEEIFNSITIELNKQKEYLILQNNSSKRIKL